jgi:glycosyltransferase involved in cell wall biosynthesis
MRTRGLRDERWFYIPNGIDVNEWDINQELPKYFQNIIDQLKAEGLPLVCYAGGFGTANALDTLLDAAAYVRDEANILLVGNGPEKSGLVKRIENERIDNVVILPSISKNMIPKLLSQVDFLYIGWRNNPLYRFGISPNKLMDYMMAGKPIIHSVEAGNDPIFEADCGISVNPDDANAIAGAIRFLSGMSASERKQMGMNGYQYILNHRQYSTLARLFLNAIF